MASSVSRIIRLLCLGFVIPFVLSMVVYFGFSSNYTGGVFSEAGFRAQYETGIYRFRVLGRITLLEINSFLEARQSPPIAPRALFLLDRNASPRFYTAYFFNNTLFLCLTCCTLLLLFDRFSSPQALWIGDLAVLLLCLLMAITQYVVAPYDTLSYFFLALGAFLTYGRQRPATVAALGAVVVLGALTRETAALIPAFYLAVHHRPLLARPFRFSIHLAGLIVSALCFVATYAALRLALGFEAAFHQDVQLAYNLSNPFGVAGLLFFGAVLAVLLLSGPGRREGAVFLLVSLPYSLFLLATGILWEIRLWVPVILALVVLKVAAAATGHRQEEYSA